MLEFGNYEFMIGIAVGKILVGAVLASSLFRAIAMASAASAIAFLYFDGGIIAILKIGVMLRTDLLAHPEFAHGIALGGALAVLLGAALRRWSSRWASS